jgi:hypothetical protein
MNSSGGAPLGYWHLDEPNSATILTAPDASGNGKALSFPAVSLAGTTGVNLGQPGGINATADLAANFNGVNPNYAWMSDNYGFAGSSPGNNFSFELWVKPTSFSCGGSGTCVLLSKRSGGAAQGYELDATGSATTFIRYLNSAVQGSGAGAPLAPGKWTHVVVTYDGATVKLYENGTLSTFQASAQAGGVTTGTPFILGALDGPANFFNGALDEVAVYGYALTATDVTNHYTRGRDGGLTPAVSAGANAIVPALAAPTGSPATPVVVYRQGATGTNKFTVTASNLATGTSNVAFPALAGTTCAVLTGTGTCASVTPASGTAQVEYTWDRR